MQRYDPIPIEEIVAAQERISDTKVPEYRGTMMSLSQVILVLASYNVFGVLGIASIVASIIFHIFVIDPT